MTAEATDRKAERKRRSHEAILASAAALMRGRGIRASSVGDVMKGAGLTVGGFYGHFDSKEHLFAETIRCTAGEVWGRLVGAVKGGTPAERARHVLGRYLSRTHRDHPEEGCLLPSVAPEVAREGGDYREALADELAGFVDTLTKALGEGRRDDAVAMVALMYGALSLSRAVAGTPLSDELLRAARRFGERAVASPERARP